MVLRPATLNTRLQMKGSAIILALGITSLVVIIAAAMIMTLRMDMRRVEKLELMTERHSLIIASESMALKLLENIHEEALKPQHFAFEEGSIRINGELSELQPSDAEEDNNLVLLHTRLVSKKTIDVYSLFKKNEEGWSLFYRSQGAHP